MNFTIKKFFSYYKPYLPLFLTVLTCAMVTAALTLVFPLLVRNITKGVLEGELTGAITEVYRMGWLMFIVVVIQNLGNFFVDFKGYEIGARMERDMRSELFAHMQKLPFDFYDKVKTGELMSRITNDLLLLSELYHHGPEDYIKYLVRFAGAFMILFFINAQLTIAIFCFLPVLGVFMFYFNRRLNFAIRANKERIGKVNAQADDSLSGIRVVKSFANESVEINKFNRENNLFLDSRKHTYKAEALFYNSVEAILQFITITLVVYGSSLIVKNSLDIADLITFLMYTSFMIEPIQRLTHMSTQLQEGITGFQRFMEIMNLQPAIANLPHARKISEVKGEIEFRNVSFLYDGRLDNVLNNLSLRIRQGEYVALVGPSGAGKSTLCSLIPRFYDVKEGKVLLDGLDVRDIDLLSLRKHIGVVQQDIYLFAGSVFENILYGNPAASKKR